MMMIIKVFVLIGFFYLSKSQKLFMPNLPLGEYRLVFDKVYPCESTKNHSMKFNLYLSKKTLTTTEMKGNITFLIPFDDTLILDVNFASWSLTGGWLPNAYVFITKNACSRAKLVLGNVWFSMATAMNIPSSCPLPPATYVIPGVDVKILEDNNFPKVYFYGKYKAVFKVKNVANKLLGCVTYEMQLIRPWEKPI